MIYQTIDLSQENLTLTAYVLDSSNEMKNAKVRPAILIFPGGGYHYCSDREAEPIAMAYLAEGFHAFVLRYSTKQNAEYPRPLNDAEEALELIRERSQEWGVDPNKVAVCGFSAGGHLAAALGTMGRTRPNALILGYPWIMESTSNLFPVAIPGVDQSVTDATPPVFLFHTLADALVPVVHALTFVAALEGSKVPFELHIFQNGGHGLSLAKPVTSGGFSKQVDPHAANWFGLSVSWLINQFGNFEKGSGSIHDVAITEFSMDVPLGDLWDNLSCRQAILDELPALANFPVDDEQIREATLRVLIGVIPDMASSDVIDRLNQRLRDIPVV
ncbi:alpha/beta hydrolase [Paenibacillus sinopodophylli]|uniref:alpha/beta hydrolase n=1 Tax=Paenibacillus sinopodophylli TaxID=1837342 RepID=UPI00110D0783|nr:alpha/beta hydrolase [Paenibacillus sinopodophylli]